MVNILDLLLEKVLLDLAGWQAELQLVHNVLEGRHAVILLNVASAVAFYV
jgi:hypothetical protein